MDPEPIVLLTLLAATGLSAVATFTRGRPFTQSALHAVKLGIVLSFVAPPALIAMIIVVSDGASRLAAAFGFEVICVGGYLGIITALGTLICGPLAAAAGAGLHMLLDGALGDRWKSPMTVRRGSVIVTVSAIGFALTGGAIGYSIGRFSPEHYRSLYRDGQSPDFRPIQVGTGLGLIQGLLAGAIVGAVIVFAVALAARREPANVTLDVS